MEQKRMSPWVGRVIALIIGLLVGAAVTARSQGPEKRRASLDVIIAPLDKNRAWLAEEYKRLYRLHTTRKRLEARQEDPSGD